MNRAKIERGRQAARQDAEQLKHLIGDDRAAPATPMEAYRRAEYFSALRLAILCDALLAEEEPDRATDAHLRPQRPAWAAFSAAFSTDTPLLVCVRCGLDIPACEGANYGWHGVKGPAHIGDCPDTQRPPSPSIDAARNWSA